MPCYDPRGNQTQLYVDPRTARELNKRTAMLCKLCKLLEVENPQYFDDPELSKWWGEHKAFDKLRLAIAENTSPKP